MRPYDGEIDFKCFEFVIEMMMIGMAKIVGANPCSNMAVLPDAGRPDKIDGWVMLILYGGSPLQIS